MTHASVAGPGSKPHREPAARPIAMRSLGAEVVARMMRLRGGGEPVMLRFGISDNTWRKIRAGEPIRASVADRLMTRLSAIDRGG